MINRWMSRITGAVHPNHVVSQDVNIPHDKGAGSEVVGAFIRLRTLYHRTIIVFTSNLNGKDWGAVEELPPLQLTDVEGYVRAERAPVWQVHYEPDIIRESIANRRTSLILAQTHIDFATCASWYASRWCHQDQFSIHDFSLGVLWHAVELFNRCLDLS